MGILCESLLGQEENKDGDGSRGTAHSGAPSRAGKDPNDIGALSSSSWASLALSPLWGRL